MGVDIPLAVLDSRIGLFSYFKQLFAQVTNPPHPGEIVTDTSPPTRPMTGICSRNSRTTAGAQIHNLPFLTSPT